MKKSGKVPSKKNTMLRRDESQVSVGAYDVVRFNAMKHGVLSKQVVLSHEDGSEYDSLLSALLDEHKPTGITDRHLVQELADTIWRKRRVLIAEGAAINRGLKRVIKDGCDIMAVAMPLEHVLECDAEELVQALRRGPEAQAALLAGAEGGLSATRRAASILKQGGKKAYAEALKQLTPESQEWWCEMGLGDGSNPSAEDLADFIDEYLEPSCQRLVAEMSNQAAIKAQAIGEGIHAHRLETLGRYETHLDRKFERTLAMLLKLKELRVEPSS